AFPRTLTDSRGKPITLNAPPQRIVSMSPSNTEILFALGLGEKIVGDTTACDYPPEAKSKPHVSGAPGRMDMEKILAQNPDLVVGVVAINKKEFDALEAAKITALSVDPKTVADTYDAILLLGKATGKDAEAAKIVADMKAQIEAVQQTAAKAEHKPIV